MLRITSILAALALSLALTSCSSSTGSSLSQRQESIAPEITGHRVFGTAYRNEQKRDIDLYVVFPSDGDGFSLSYIYKSVGDTVSMTAATSKIDKKHLEYELVFHFLEAKVELKGETFDIAKGNIFALDAAGKPRQLMGEVKGLKDAALRDLVTGK